MGAEVNKFIAFCNSHYNRIAIGIITSVNKIHRIFIGNIRHHSFEVINSLFIYDAYLKHQIRAAPCVTTGLKRKHPDNGNC